MTHVGCVDAVGAEMVQVGKMSKVCWGALAQVGRTCEGCLGCTGPGG